MIKDCARDIVLLKLTTDGWTDTKHRAASLRQLSYLEDLIRPKSLRSSRTRSFPRTILVDWIKVHVISLFGSVFRWDCRSVLNSGLRPKISQKVKLFFFVWTQRFTETKLRTERSRNPKLINSPIDFACGR